MCLSSAQKTSPNACAEETKRRNVPGLEGIKVFSLDQINRSIHAAYSRLYVCLSIDNTASKQT
jgi:hypothetical protein